MKRVLTCLVHLALVAAVHGTDLEAGGGIPLVERLADLPTPVAGGALLELSDDRLLYAGGTTWADGQKRWLHDVHIYDVAEDQWRPGPPLPEPIDASLPLTLSVDGRWLLLGGESRHGMSNRGVELIEIDGQLSWELTDTVPFHKASAAGAMVGGVMVVVGGADDHDSYADGQTTVWLGRRAPTAGKGWLWERDADFPGQAHSVAASAVYGGWLYVFGGLYADHGAAKNTDEAFRYTPSDGWQRRAPMPLAVRGATAVAVEGVGIVIVGGWGDDGPRREIFLYRPDADLYEPIGLMPQPTVVASGIAVGQDVYLAGNEDKPASRRADVYRLRLQHTHSRKPLRK